MPTSGSLKELQLNLTGVNEKLVNASCSLQLIVVLMKKKRLLLQSLSTHRAQLSLHSTRVIFLVRRCLGASTELDPFSLYIYFFHAAGKIGHT